MFSFSFTDRYRRDGLAGVRVPRLSPDIWRYAIRDADGGAMLWRDEADEMVAFNLAHHSGVEGWMGPLAVRPDSQGHGLGKTIVSTAIAWLKGVGATTIGLETMPRTVENIGFYGGLDFVPGHLTMSLSRVVEAAPRPECRLLSETAADGRSLFVDQARDLVQRSLPGIDFGREFELTHELAIGDTLLLDDASGPCAVCLFHSSALALNRQPDEIRVLKLFANSLNAFRRVIHAVEALAGDYGINQVSIRAQSNQHEPLRLLQQVGYRVRWTDLRMTLHGFEETVPPGHEVLYSNWEI